MLFVMEKNSSKHFSSDSLTDEKFLIIVSSAQIYFCCSSSSANRDFFGGRNLNFRSKFLNFGIFSEIDGPHDFNEILVNGSVLNVVSMDNISFLRKSLFKKLSAFKVIYFVRNSEENETFIFHIYCMLQKTF